MPRRDKRLARKPDESHCTTRGRLSPKLPIDDRTSPPRLVSRLCPSPTDEAGSPEATGPSISKRRRVEPQFRSHDRGRNHRTGTVASSVIPEAGARLLGIRDASHRNLRASLNHLRAALFSQRRVPGGRFSSNSRTLRRGRRDTNALQIIRLLSLMLFLLLHGEINP